MKTVVVIPTYNEAICMPSLLDALASSELDLDVLVVDDASPDGTADVVRAWSQDHSTHVRVLARKAKEGLGAAYRAGFDWAIASGYEVIAQMDADGSHPVEALQRMFRELVAGSDVVIGSRYAPGGGYTTEWPLRRRLLSRAGNAYARWILQTPVRDLTGGFKMWRRNALAHISGADVSARGYAFQVQTTYAAVRNGARVAEVPIVFAQRAHGESKMSAAVIAEALMTLPRLRSRGDSCRPSPVGSRALGGTTSAPTVERGSAIA